MRLCPIYIAFTLLILLPGSLLSQALPEQLVFEQLIIPGTIRSSEIVDVLQDPEGTIWVAADGLFQYDGLSFSRYVNLLDSGSIGGREINGLFYDAHQKRLLIATRNYGIVEYDYDTNTLRKLPARDGVPIVNELIQTSNGRVWATTFNSGLYYVEHDTIKKFTNPKVLTNTATSLAVSGDVLFVGDVSKLFVINNNEIIDSVYLAWPNTEFTAYGRVTTMEVDSKNNLYIGTEKQGALVYDLNKKKFTKYFSPDTNPFYNRINDIFVDRNQLIWILTKSGGIAVYSPSEDTFIHAIRNPLSSSSLSGDNCTSIFEDKTGIIWVGATGALNKYDATKIKLLSATSR